MIYVMKFRRGGYKIGCTSGSDMRQRYQAKAMREGIVMTLDGDFDTEAALHKLYASKRMPFLFEVFDLNQDDLAQLAAMPGAKPYQE